MLRVMFFGTSSSYSAAHLNTLAGAHRVVGVFCAAGRGARGVAGRILRTTGLLNDPCGTVARAHGVPRWFVDRDASAAADRITALRPDIICVAGYPWLLPPSIWTRPPLGAVNSHPSLLPRHRGVLPLFWVYYHDDRQTGVTVHRISGHADSGAILEQDAYPLARGLEVDRLNALNTERGAAAMARALGSLAEGSSCDIPQNSAAATCAPFVRAGTPMVDFSWDVERVWHFLSGLFPWFTEPLRDADGDRIAYAGVLGYERTSHDRVAGSVSGADKERHLFCRGGLVRLATRRR